MFSNKYTQAQKLNISILIQCEILKKRVDFQQINVKNKWLRKKNYTAEYIEKN